MATFTTDFSTDTTGAAPTGWTGNAGWTGTVVADAGATGGKVLRATGGQSWITLDQWYGKSTVDFTVRLRKTGSAGQTESGVFFRGQSVALYSNSDFLYQKMTGGGADLGASGPAASYAANTWYKIRIQADATRFRAKWWNDSVAEPDTWQITKVGNIGNEDLGIGLYHYSYSAGNNTEFDTASFAEYGVEDFSDQPIAQFGTASGWTPASSAWSVEADAGATGGKVARYTNVSAADGYLRKTLAESRNDVDITTRLKGSGTSGYGILLGDTKSEIHVRAAGSNIGIYTGASGTVSGTAAATFAFTVPTNTWWNLRARKTGATLYVKAWADGAAEPSSWDYTGTPANVLDNYTRTPFYNGLIVYNVTGTYDFDTVKTTFPETSTDFSSDAAGANPPALFTKHANFGPSVPWTVTDDGVGNKFLRNVYNNDNQFNRMLVFEPMTNVNDVDVTTRVRCSGTTMPEVRLGAYNSGSTWPDSTVVTFGSSPQKLLRVQNIRAGSFAFNETVNYAWTANTWLNVRVQKVGKTIKVKVWADGAAEPSTWLYTKTHDNIFETRTPFTNGVSAATGGTDTQDFDLFGFTSSAPPPVSYSFTQDAPAANTAEALAPTLNLQTSIQIDVPIADSSAGAFDAEVTAVIQMDGSVNLAGVPVPGAYATALDPGAGVGSSIPIPVVSASGGAFDPTIAPTDHAYTDFGDQSTNAMPSGWSGSSSGATVQNDAGATGGKVLRLSGAAGTTTRRAQWDFLGDIASGDVLVRLRAPTQTGRAVRVDFQDFWVQLIGGPTSLELQIYKSSDGTRWAGQIVTSLASVSATDWWWLRISPQGRLIRAHTWKDGTAEPSTWSTATPYPTRDFIAGPFALEAASSDASSGVDNTTNAFTSDIDSISWSPATSPVATTTVALRSQVLPLIQKNLGLRWAATKAIDKSVAASWNIGSETSLTKTVGLAWTSVQTVQATMALRWAAAREIVSSRSLRWVFAQEVDAISRALRWDVRTSVGAKTVDLRWGQVRTVDAPTTVNIPWQAEAPVESRLITRWVTQSEGRVTLSLRTRWNSLVTVTKTLRERWSANLDALGVQVEDFDTKTTGELTPGQGLKVIDNRLRSRPDVNPGAPQYSAWTIVEDPFLFGGKALQGRGLAGSQSPAMLYFEGEPDPWEHDVVARIRLVDSTPGLAQWQESIRQLLEFDQAGNTSYNLSSAGNIWTFNFVRDTGSGSTIVQSSSMILSIPDDTWIWTRIQVRRDVTNLLTQAKAKIWLDGTPEPKNWMLDFTVNGMQGFPYAGSVPILTGASGQYTMLTGHLDVDRVSWTTPSTRVVVDGPATAAFGSQVPSVSLRQTIQAPTGRAGISFPEPIVEIGDQVLVSWMVLEIPAAISVVEAVEVDDLGSAELEMPAPSVAAQASRSFETPNALQTSVQMPAPVVTGHSGVVVEVDDVAQASILAPDQLVRVVAYATVLSVPATALAEALAPTLDTELNAQITAPVATATFRALKPDSINGSREVEVGLISNAGFSMIPVQGVVATLSIQVDNATLAQAQMLPADARTGLAVATSPATASGSALVPAVQTSIRIVPPPIVATARARDAIIRTTTRFSVGTTALVIADAPDPVVQVFFQREDAIVTGASAYSLFKAVAPEFLSTPAEIGDALVLYLGQMVADVRLSGRKVDVTVGSTRGSVSLADVRDEERV